MTSLSTRTTADGDSGARVIFRRAHGGGTDVGRRRKHNEDAIVVVPEVGLFAVCDGVGGHSKGDVASALSCQALEDGIREGAAGPADGPEAGAFEHDARRLLAAVLRANADVVQASRIDGKVGDMGSTVVALLWVPGARRLHICHVGDSRCYRLRDGDLELLTEDHNLINEALKKNPDISKAVLKKLPKNVVTRALGMADVVEPDLCTVELRDGDQFLLCSDGLHGMVVDPVIQQTLELIDNPELACEELIALANEAGGKDNVSAVLVRAELEEAMRDALLPEGAALEDAALEDWDDEEDDEPPELAVHHSDVEGLAELEADEALLAVAAEAVDDDLEQDEPVPPSSAQERLSDVSGLVALEKLAELETALGVDDSVAAAPVVGVGEPFPPTKDAGDEAATRKHADDAGADERDEPLSADEAVREEALAKLEASLSDEGLDHPPADDAVGDTVREEALAELEASMAVGGAVRQPTEAEEEPIELVARGGAVDDATREDVLAELEDKFGARMSTTPIQPQQDAPAIEMAEEPPDVDVAVELDGMELEELADLEQALGDEGIPLTDKVASSLPPRPELGVVINRVMDVAGSDEPIDGTVADGPPPSWRVTYCIDCGSELKRYAAVCDNCGAIIEDEAVIPCPSCDRPLELDSSYCVECGKYHGLFD